MNGLGDFTVKQLSPAASNEATSGHQKLKMKYRSLSHNMIHASTVLGTMWKSSGIAIKSDPFLLELKRNNPKYMRCKLISDQPSY